MYHELLKIKCTFALHLIIFDTISSTFFVILYEIIRHFFIHIKDNERNAFIYLSLVLVLFKSSTYYKHVFFITWYHNIDGVHIVAIASLTLCKSFFQTAVVCSRLKSRDALKVKIPWLKYSIPMRVSIRTLKPYKQYMLNMFV